MATTIALTIVCLLLAAACVMHAERLGGNGRWRPVHWIALAAGYGTCVGASATLLIYFFPLGTMWAVVLAVPAGAPLMLVCALLSERS